MTGFFKSPFYILFPNYIAKSVIEGFEEYEYLMDPEQTQCLIDIKDSSQFAGVWTWSRGGGWLGPQLINTRNYENLLQNQSRDIAPIICS